MAVIVDNIGGTLPKYKDQDTEKELTAAEQSRLKGAIEIFLQTKKKEDIKADPQMQNPLTLVPAFASSDAPNAPKFVVDFAVTVFDSATEKATVTITNLENLLPVSGDVPAINVLSGAERFVDGGMHVGIAIELSSDGKTSILTIPDVGEVKNGKSPVYITKPLVLKLSKLETFLKNKKVTLPAEVSRLLNDAQLSCDAFYFTANDGPLLMMFQVRFTKGLIASLTGDKDIGELFDIKGAAVRVFRSKQEDFAALQHYAAELRDVRALPAGS